MNGKAARQAVARDATARVAGSASAARRGQRGSRAMRARQR